MAMGEMEVDGAAKRRKNVWNRTQQACTFWLQGRCNRNPCSFLHVGESGGSGQTSVMNMNGNSKRSGFSTDGGRSSIAGGRWGKSGRSADGTHKISTKPCLYFLRNTCTRGEHCKFLHAHSTTTDMAFIAQLTGHEKAVTAITLPENTNTLYTGGQDETIRIWDCATGEGALSLCGFKDPQGRSILLCSYNDNTIRLFDLPSFMERGILFSKEEARSLHIGPKGLIFSGDSSGEVKVWKWAFPAAAAP